jgi:hypothetical protein
MRASTAFFVGVGTVIVAIGSGLGGGWLIADIMNPHSPKQRADVTRLERRMSSEPIPAANAPAERVPYLAATQQPPSAGPAPTQTTQPKPQTEAAKPAPQPARTTKANEPTAKQQDTPKPQDTSKPQDTAKPSSARSPQSAAREQPAKPDDAAARAREDDLKRTAEKRNAERRQQWADRRHQQREDQEPRDFSQQPVRAFTERPVGLDFPPIRMFRPDDEDEQ